MRREINSPGNGVLNVMKEYFGEEALVIYELRELFPGIGGTIMSKQPVLTARRIEHNQVEGVAAKMFYRHVIIKKLDDCFQRQKAYRWEHIARPLGFTSLSTHGQEAYYYEFVHGTEAFPCMTNSPEGGPATPVQIEEWSEFSGSFSRAGIDMSCDITDPDNGRVSKNIIHQSYSFGEEILNRVWKRIDFGLKSLTVDYKKLGRFLAIEEPCLRQFLRDERYELLRFSYLFLTLGGKLDPWELERLEELTRAYRLATLSHKRAVLVTR